MLLDTALEPSWFSFPAGYGVVGDWIARQGVLDSLINVFDPAPFRDQLNFLLRVDRRAAAGASSEKEQVFWQL